MPFHKKFHIHWPIIIPNLVILALLASVLGVVVFYTGRGAEAGQPVTPERVTRQYALSIDALRQEVSASAPSATILVARAEETLFSIRVPKERLDTHLAAVIQLRALKRALPTTDDAEARERLLEILRSL